MTAWALSRRGRRWLAEARRVLATRPSADPAGPIERVVDDVIGYALMGDQECVALIAVLILPRPGGPSA